MDSLLSPISAARKSTTSFSARVLSSGFVGKTHVMKQFDCAKLKLKSEYFDQLFCVYHRKWLSFEVLINGKVAKSLQKSRNSGQKFLMYCHRRRCYITLRATGLARAGQAGRKKIFGFVGYAYGTTYRNF